jgi:hypothetical protein
VAIHRLIDIEGSTEHFTIVVSHSRQGFNAFYWSVPGKSKTGIVRKKGIAGAVANVNEHLAVRMALDQIEEIDRPIWEMLQSSLLDQRRSSCRLVKPTIPEEPDSLSQAPSLLQWINSMASVTADVS